MVQPVQIAPDGRSLTRGGQPFFWLADTCWSAFTNITNEEWTAYLDHRAAQGFNVLQINTLPQWDRCGSLLDVYPFPTADGFTYDTGTLLPEYFDRARSMCREAVDRGFTLALVVMWCNYVPGSWAANIFPGNILPEEHVEPIVRTICEAFNEFAPVYIVSGDTGFEDPATTERYLLVTDLVEKYAPKALKAYHIKGRYDGLPQSLAERADIYLYQSGHNAAGQGTAVTLAQSFLAREPRRPVINSEPCYEQMGYSHRVYGRFRRAETRCALWNSLLSGASAGITYGAHGVWNWQKPNMPRNPNGGEGFLRALPCQEALRLPGAEDFAFAKKFFLENGITAVTPCQEVLTQYAEHIRAAMAGDILLLYVPTNAPLTLNGHWTTAEAIDLESGSQAAVAVAPDGDQTHVEMHPFYSDALMVLR